MTEYVILGLKWISGIIVIVLSKNKISELIQLVKASKKNDYIYQKAEDGSKIDELLTDLRMHYGVDRCILYFFHNGQYASNGYSFYKFSCLSESYDKHKLVGRKEEQQNMPLGLMSQWFKHYRDKGMIVCHDRNKYNGDIDSFKEALESLNVDSTYSNTFKDMRGNITCLLIMNMESKPKKITNFDYFNKIGTIIGELMTEKK